ncbi:hypothetical protein QR680_003123 [Steinernema hermaphroditum]|uniref:Uncharacterized protein n=1 Tax=Steinernema hermaphroditum TaxID=289476 RepID=A0AA39LJQ3_9BILA|nr:hypothetical protein QR680_003123 [Steinernema hermaphroditum]
MYGDGEQCKAVKEAGGQPQPSAKEVPQRQAAANPPETNHNNSPGGDTANDQDASPAALIYKHTDRPSTSSGIFNPAPRNPARDGMEDTDMDVLKITAPKELTEEEHARNLHQNGGSMSETFVCLADKKDK